MFPTSLSRPAAGLAATAVILLALAGCAAPAGPGGEPSASSSGGAAVSDAEFGAARDAYDLELADCLRGKGFDIKDPQPGQGIQESSEEINAAASICMSEIGDPPVAESPLSDVELLTAQLAWAQCFRDLGYGVAEPSIGQAFVIPDAATDDEIAACTDPAL
jgi:hypothetical protein